MDLGNFQRRDGSVGIFRTWRLGFAKKKKSARHSVAGLLSGIIAKKGRAVRLRRFAGAGPGHGRERQGTCGFKTPADSKRTGSDAVWLAGGQTCEIKCDCLLCI